MQPITSPRAGHPLAAAAGAAPDLVVLSHLRWTWVWQRPQHLVSRLARARRAGGARTYVVEEPLPADVAAPTLRRQDVDGITRVWIEVPDGPEMPRYPGFGHESAPGYEELVAELLVADGRPPRPDVWLYTALALDMARAIGWGRLVYDVMDDLAAFKDASPRFVLRHRRALAAADVVFTGGRSLHRSTTELRTCGVHCFPSGVETAHYRRSRTMRRPHERPVAGFVGVLDERLDRDLVAGLAAALPDWTVRLVGPLAKIEESDLPRAANLDYPGMAAYDRLPEVMAGFDVAIMPFALNEATRSISPTKTLEYLAAGLPVVSTRVPDVVADCAEYVSLADGPADFAPACRAALEEDRDGLLRRVEPVLAAREWDRIAEDMATLLEATPTRSRTAAGALAPATELRVATLRGTA